MTNEKREKIIIAKLLKVAAKPFIGWRTLA